ncbi:conjugal transfer protein TraD [Fluoribacter dumoffii]|uniref:Protein TraD n=2 Tax=Legionellaceae TaxID=444 RepID=A0A0W0SBZ2_9GAMM|nr:MULTISPECIES: conjugal transfer protein TraD [Legionellaceae]HAT1993776.1 conjugal transfer protein TraD [Legionella pneumophila]KTC81071.1 protein TraD [Legionella cherrii]KTC91324.1 protein TraD [Fluoribacter dumoffii NY 23]MCW8416945.1 conjugal transfer protein TraD [Fluoribacter dumoffii]MCW8455215.1 conjugal transfer protein TraD [Fluoribacter dumoffii]
MTLYKKIITQEQLITRLKNSVASTNLKKRRADTRRKIEFGGLIIKSGIDVYNKSIILGALDYTLRLIEQDASYQNLFEARGDTLFLLKS